MSGWKPVYVAAGAAKGNKVNEGGFVFEFGIVVRI
jgi:hypothetical protein